MQVPSSVPPLSLRFSSFDLDLLRDRHRRDEHREGSLHAPAGTRVSRLLVSSLQLQRRRTDNEPVRDRLGLVLVLESLRPSRAFWL